MTEKITLTNIAKVRNLTIENPDGGGAIVLKGRNGIGKTTTLTAIEAVVNHNAKPVVTHGEPKGTVDAFGVTLHVGKQTRRSGELEVAALDGKLSISDLIDPGINDREIADQHRLRALVSIITPNPDQVRSLVESMVGECSDVADAKWYGMGDPVEIVSYIKRKFEARAREFESKAEKLQAEVKRHTLNAGERPHEPEPIDAVRAELTAAIEARASLTQAHVAWERRQQTASQTMAQVEELQANIDAMFIPDDAMHVLSQAVLDCRTNLEQKQATVAELRTDVEQLEIKLAALRNQLSLQENCADVADDQLRVAVKNEFESAEMMAKHNQAVESLAVLTQQLNTPDPCPLNYETLSQADQRCLQAEASIAAHAAATKAWESHKQAVAERANATALESQADHARAAAASVEQALTTLVKNHMDSLVVDNGRLYLAEGERRTLFDELSAGQRARIAVEIGLKVVGERGVIVLRQEIWEGLDPINRAELDQVAKHHHAWIITAMATADEQLTSEIM